MSYSLALSIILIINAIILLVVKRMLKKESLLKMFFFAYCISMLILLMIGVESLKYSHLVGLLITELMYMTIEFVILIIITNISNLKFVSQFLLGEVGAGLVLIIIQFITGFDFAGNLFYVLGRNFFATLGVASIFDGIRKIDK